MRDTIMRNMMTLDAIALDTITAIALDSITEDAQAPHPQIGFTAG
jgi:hypothetical protein